MHTDAELISSFVSGEESAFAELAGRHGQMVYRVCLRILSDPHEAEDAAQAVFICLARKAQSLRKSVNLTAWLHGVARNVSLRSTKARASRKKREEVAAMRRAEIRESKESRSLPELDRAMNFLPAAEREAVVLRYLENRSEKEAAAIAGCPQGTLGWRASKGLQRLRSRLAHGGAGLGLAPLTGVLQAEAALEMPASLLATFTTASQLSAGAGIGNALTLAEGTMKAMMMTKIKIAVAVVCIATVIGGGGLVTVQQLSAGEVQARFKPNPKLAGLADNTAVLLGKFGFARPKGEGWIGSVTDFSGMTYDHFNNRVLLFGGGHSTTATDAIYAFDIKTLKWGALYTPTPTKFFKRENHKSTFWKSGLKDGKYPRPVGRHTYDMLIVPPDRQELLLLRSGSCLSSKGKFKGYLHGMTNGAGGAYDFKTGQWTMILEKELKASRNGHATEYDPVSKKIILLKNNFMTVFDPVTRKGRNIWIKAPSKKQAYEGTLVYYPPDKNMYVFSRATKNVWVLQLDRADFKKSQLVELTTSGKGPTAGSGNGMAYDSKNEIIGGFLGGKKFYCFDPKAKKWSSQTIKGQAPTNTIFYCNTYSPVDNVFLLISGKMGRKPGQQTFAYRYKR
jgi:RNA polymerase sigma factor (sigma-70 family)